MEIIFSPQALEDLQFWKKSGNIKIQNRIQMLLESTNETRSVEEAIKYAARFSKNEILLEDEITS